LCQEQEYRTGKIEPYTVLGEVAIGLGNFPEAKIYFRKALHIAIEVWVPSYALHALVGMAKLLAAVGEKEQALELATCIGQHPASWQWSKDSIAPLSAELEAELPPDVVEAVESWVKEKELKEVIEELISLTYPQAI